MAADEIAPRGDAVPSLRRSSYSSLFYRRGPLHPAWRPSPLALRSGRSVLHHSPGQNRLCAARTARQGAFTTGSRLSAEGLEVGRVDRVRVKDVECGEQTITQRVEIVAAFGDQRESAGSAGGDPQPCNDAGIASRAHPHCGERIRFVRVVAGRDEGQLRSELLEHRHRDGAIHEVEVRIRRAGLERDVDGEAAARPPFPVSVAAPVPG